MRITVACPEALIGDANHLAMCLAYGPADGQTYGVAVWRDAVGNRYAAASFDVPEAWIAAAQGPLERPEWDGARIIDIAAAGRAQAALSFALAPVAADPARITAIGGMAGAEAMVAMGLSSLQ